MAELPWDPRMATEAAVADQCQKLGGVVLRPERPTGFSSPPPRPPEKPER